MSRNGQLALQRIIVSYSTTKGSPNTRQFLSTHLPVFKQKYPSVSIDIRPRMWPECGITGIYRDGSEKFFNTRGLSTMGIFIRCHRLVNECNDYDVPFTATHMHFQRKSVQGTWNPWLWMAERPYSRKVVPKWDRKLSEKEWDYYVDKFSTNMVLEEEAVQSSVAKHSELPKRFSEEVAARWKEFVVPRLQTDIEHNLQSFKTDFQKGVKRDPVRLGQYRLFAVPDLNELGQDAVQTLRGNEIEKLETWWKKRKEQLKPPK